MKQQIVEWVEIHAPRENIFNLVVNLERRMQLSPLWGLAALESVSPDYPRPGSHYFIHFVSGDKSRYETVVTHYQPGRQFAYRLVGDRQSQVSWLVQDTPRGTRLVYREEFLPDETDQDGFSDDVHKVAHQWLGNIKRYAELGRNPAERLLKRVMDRFYLRLYMDQRRILQFFLLLPVASLFGAILSLIIKQIAALI